MKRPTKFFLLLFLCVCFYTGFAQEQLKKHTVSEDETISSIAKKYKVTPYEIQQANQVDINAVKVNDVLIIPESNIESPKLESASDAVKTSQNNTSLVYTVKKGDTKFSLAKRFGLTIKGLEIKNPQIVPVLQEGQILNVPEDIMNAPPSDSETYVVTNVDTKFGLAKKFNFSISELERENPHIVKMLIVGQTIKIPSKGISNAPSKQLSENKNTSNHKSTPPVTRIEKIKEIKPSPASIETAVVKKNKPEKTSEINSQPKLSPKEPLPETPARNAIPMSDQAYSSYKVQPEETLYGLATKAGMSVDDFLKLNPELKESVQIGTLIKMPKDVIQAQLTPNSKYINLARSLNTTKTKKILFFLPFSQIEYDDYGTNNTFSSVSNEFKKKHLEFYKGASIAIDSLRNLNLNLDVDIVVAQNTLENSKIQSLAKADNINSYDAVIYPYYDTINDVVAEAAKANTIPIVTGATITHQDPNNNLYGALPSVNLQRKTTLDYMLSKNANMIVISDIDRTESKSFITKQAPNAAIINLTRNGTFSNDALVAKFKKDQLNYVIIDSQKNSVFLSTTNVLLSQLSNYNIQIAVLESDLIPDQGDVSKKRYQILKMIFPSVTPAETLSAAKKFTKTYQKKYKILPTPGVLLGFDITYDTLLRLAQQQSFQNSAENQVTEYTQLKFDYGKNTMGSYSNQGIYILHYDTGSAVKEAH